MLMVAEKYGGPWAETGALIRDHEIGASFPTGVGHLKTLIGDNYENSSGRHRNCIHRSAERGPEKVFRKTILLRTWSASSRRRRRMDSRFSSLLIISIPRTKDGNSMDPSKLMRLPQV